uniref:Uncharacterized protein n=1 Tax=Onchocerca volvulus TaxID=6282 RepID=A0A8R1TZG1_ONCVO
MITLYLTGLIFPSFRGELTFSLRSHAPAHSLVQCAGKVQCYDRAMRRVGYFEITWAHYQFVYRLSLL